MTVRRNKLNAQNAQKEPGVSEKVGKILKRADSVAENKLYRGGVMTTQKCHVEGQVVLLTKSCTQRQFLLHNGRDGFVKRAMGFLVALIAIRTHQVVHGLCFMSNHYHSVQTDRSASRSKFAQDMHHFATKIINKFRKRRESIWSDPFGDAHLSDTNEVIEKLLYVWLNPVEAGLVDRVEEWDNFMILPKHWGKTLTFERPNFFTGESGTPQVIKFTPMPPPGFDHMPLKEVIVLFERFIEEEENRILAERKYSSIGMERIYETSPFSTPKTPRKMYTLNPTVSGKDKTKVSRLLAWKKNFVLKYRAAMDRFKATGEAVFPPGTLKMVRLFKCKVEPPLPTHPNFRRYARYG